MSITVSINNKPFVLWESATLRRSIDENCGEYSFTSSSGVPRTEFPVNAGDLAEVFVDGYRMAVGYVDTIRVQESSGRHTISIEGRDEIQDLIDSSVPTAAKVATGPMTMKALCQRVIDALGSNVKVLDWISPQNNPELGLEPFTALELQAGQSADKCMEYLVSFARKRQVYLVSMVDGEQGYLVIYRPFAGDRAVSPLLHKENNNTNNILRYNLKVSQAKRFESYICVSQGNFAFQPLNKSEDWGVTSNEVHDTSKRDGKKVMRDSRFLEIQAEESMFKNDLLVRAIEECNLRRVNGSQYTCTVAGHTQANGVPWDFGQFVQIEDDFAGIHGQHLIKEVEFTVDTTNGTLTKLNCIPPDGYQTIPIESPVLTRKTVTGRLNEIAPYPIVFSEYGTTPQDNTIHFKPGFDKDKK